MRYPLLVLVLIVFLTPLYSADLITIKEVKGKVEVKGPGGSWVKASEGNVIAEGSLISTGFKSYAELDLSGTSTIYIKQLTRMAVDKLATSGNNVDTKLNLRLGRIKADVKRVREILAPGIVISPSHEAILPNVSPENIIAMAEAVREG